MTGSILFGIGTLIVLVGLGVWIAIIVQRANRINHASSSRLSNDLSQFASNPELLKDAPGSRGVPEPIVFSDDLPAEVTAIADAAVAEEPAEPKAVAEPVPVADAEPPASPADSAPAPAPTSELEARLAKLDDLHARGVITDAEHSAARLSALSD